MANLTKLKTFTGRFIDPINPHPDDISIEDIAHALSNMPRFAGHTKRFYSVAEHCLRCVHLVKDQNIEMEVLLHDATEAYLMDMPSPIKWRFPDYVKAEKKLANTIDIRFGLYSVMFHDRIKEVDAFVLKEEMLYLMNHGTDLTFTEEAENWYNTIKTPFQIKKEFLSLYNQLLNKNYPNGTKI